MTYRADKLDSVLFRVGLLAGLRSKKHGGKAIGIMVTASHNPEQVRIRDTIELIHASKLASRTTGSSW